MRAQFIRGEDPFNSLRIGQRAKRIFKSDEEAAQWLYNFPDVCTEGVVTKWEKNHYKNPEGIWPKYILVPSKLRLDVIKWVKRNLMWTDESDMGLKEAKDIGDRLAEIIQEKTS